MVRLDFDSERLKALRAELDQQTALLPGVLHSSDSVALVDHLTTVFNEADWTRTARCSGCVDTAAPSEPTGWEAFQSVLRAEPQPAEAQPDAQAMDSALSRLQADIHSIERTTCLPPSRLAALTASTSDQHGSGRLQAVRCTVCHSLLLAAAFDDHLPRCRPCAPQSAVPSNSSHPSSSSRQASRPGSARGRAAAKKGKGRGSKKPPAGPSRFATEQAKTPPQRQTTPRPLPDLDHQLPTHPLQQHQPHQHQHLQPLLTEAAASALPLACNNVDSSGDIFVSQKQPAHAARRHSSDVGAEQDMASQARRAKRSRSAWTYEEHLCRNNPDLDAVHDPMLPPRFPHSVTRMRCRNRANPDEPPAQPLCESHPLTSTQGLTHLAASPLAIDAVQVRNGKQAGMPQRGTERLLAPQQQPGINSIQSTWQQEPTQRHQQYTNGLQSHSPPRSSWQQAGSAHEGAMQPRQDSASHSQQGLGAAMLGQKRLLHNYPASPPQHADKRRRQAAQLPRLHQPAHSHQQDSQTTAAGHDHQQQSALLQPAGQLPTGSFKRSAQHSMHGSVSNQAKTYKPPATNSLQGEYAARPAATDSILDGHSHCIELKASNGYRIPKSKRQVSVNALARSSLGI